MTSSDDDGADDGAGAAPAHPVAGFVGRHDLGLS